MKLGEKGRKNDYKHIAFGKQKDKKIKIYTQKNEIINNTLIYF